MSFGNGMAGRLGHGDHMDQRLPKLVEALRGKKVAQVSAGGLYSLVLLEGGEVVPLNSGSVGPTPTPQARALGLGLLGTTPDARAIAAVAAGRDLDDALLLTRAGRAVDATGAPGPPMD